MSINKALLTTNLSAFDFKLTLDSWGIPARLIDSFRGEPSRYVVFQGDMLSPSQIKYLDATFAPVYCKVSVFDVKFIEEINQ